MLSYPAVYIICILPTSFSRWQYFTGSEVAYQLTLFASTLFSFCGMFDAILFFFTRRDLVVGTSDSESLPLAPAPSANPGESFHNVGPTNTCSPIAADSISPDINSQFQPYNAMLQPDGNRSGRRISRMGSDLGSDMTEMSRERGYGDFRSIPSPAPVEEESGYGHLPNR